MSRRDDFIWLAVKCMATTEKRFKTKIEDALRIPFFDYEYLFSESFVTTSK